MFDLLLQAAVDMAWQHFIEAFQTMLYTVPSTPTGLVALLACLRENREILEVLGNDNDYVDSFLETLATTVRNFATQALQTNN
jgi:hypothetical protein